MTTEGEAEDGGAEPKVSRVEIVRRAREIGEEYQRQGLVLTVRQLYYQFVARGILGSGQNIYKRIVSTLSEARVRGDFPMRLIEDRGRDAGAGDAVVLEDDVERAIARAGESLRSFPSWFLECGRWQGQPKFVSVWVEKEALTGVFEGPCKDLGVGLFACRGYPSVSSLHQWMRHAAEASETRTPRTRAYTDKDGRRVQGRTSGVAEEAVILYFGDHDPDGLEIPHSCLRTIEEMREYGTAPSGLPAVTLRRVALTRAQIDQYNPPPFPAKESSARYAKYVRETGLDEAWELDALDPATLNALIREAVDAEFDEDIYRINEERIEERRGELRERMLAPGWVRDSLGEKKEGDES